MKKRVARFLSVFVILCLLTSSACLEHAFSQSQKTFLWRVQSKTATVYILGSLHFFKKEFYPLNKKIDDAESQYKAAQKLGRKEWVRHREAAAVDSVGCESPALLGRHHRGLAGDILQDLPDDVVGGDAFGLGLEIEDQPMP